MPAAPGVIKALEAGILVISQTAVVHEQISDLLVAIRQTVQRPPLGAGADWRPPAERVVTRIYPVQLAAENREALQNQLKDLIVSFLPDQPWNGMLPDGQAVLLSVFPDRIVVRHRPSVQRQVETLLNDTGLVPPPEPQGKHAGGFFQPQPGGN